ncbi:MAG TPA: nucleoside monophosphate kinase [Rickettsiales bacterium]|nr:nucleoside monophosphate kinase [Rickettsiales bacterium]
MKDILILLGVQGSGKGTQGRILSEEFGFNIISTGDLLRKEIDSGSEIGKEIASLINNGNLVSDDLIFGILKEELKSSSAKGFILDGFPRTLEQAKMFSEYCENSDFRIKKVIFIDMDREHVLERLNSRITCKTCGKVYNLLSSRPKIDGMCDVCHSKLIVRADDLKIEAINKRINIFERNIKDIVSFYEKKSLIFSVDGLKDVNTISREIIKALNSDNKL